jgi:hypothetical protein
MVAMTTVEHTRPRPRAFWSDTRFLLGVLLVVVSIAGVWLVVSAARQTVPALAASRTIVPGEAITSDDLRVVDVALGQVGDVYLEPGSLADGAVATRTIGEGELVPVDALGDGADARVTTVVVDTAVDVPASVGEGTRVEIWHAPVVDDVAEAPRILIADATVASVAREDGVLGGADASLEIVIPRADVAALLAAQASGAVLSVVPAGG